MQVFWARASVLLTIFLVIVCRSIDVFFALVSCKSYGLTDTFVSVVATKPTKSSAHALTVISSVVLRLLVCVLLIQGWGLERSESSLAQSSFALNGRKLGHLARLVLWGSVVLAVVLGVIHFLLNNSSVRLSR